MKHEIAERLLLQALKIWESHKDSPGHQACAKDLRLILNTGITCDLIEEATQELRK